MVKCEHPRCGCEAQAAEPFCSTECESQALSEGSCLCGHPHCEDR